ncbi:MAG: DUF1722 domain-containing protein [Hahellaceae bacterium]|nr:DUF1722 domain-containing protein [Hahellaceae bacterium]MCP5168401.1 DUF1722 domain-containing protein [Hahellaceae bacterium]
MYQIWDIDAGFLDDALLTEQMRLLSGLAAAEGNHPKLPPHWLGHDGALVVRLNQLIAEMRLRGIATPDYQRVPKGAIIWPARFPLAPSEQFGLLAERQQQGKHGRISVPKSEHEIWARYKYSIMARNHNSYQIFGRLVAIRAFTFNDLLLEMVHAKRATPAETDLRNALQHMWGYVSAFSRMRPDTCSLADLLQEVQVQAKENNVQYLLNSTALGELALWC